MASDTLPVFQSANSIAVRNAAHNYSQLVVEHIRMVAKVYAAISYYNLNDPDKAQETLLALIAEYERSH